MIDRSHGLSITRQAQLVGSSRSCMYYRRRPPCAAQILLTHTLDALHLDASLCRISHATGTTSLSKGAGNASAVGTLVERNFKPASAANVLQDYTDKLVSVAQPMGQSMTYDQGREMAMHKQLSQNTVIAVYFAFYTVPGSEPLTRT